MIEEVKEMINEAMSTIIILNSSDNNIAIGGTCALALHGINLKRIPNDLDVIIYQPSEFQRNYVEDHFNSCLGSDTDNTRSWTDTSMKINILFEENEAMPKDLLHFAGRLPVNSVSNVIDAKAKYNRKKDLKDFTELKNNNFNPREAFDPSF